MTHNLADFYKKVFDIEVTETENHELSYLGTPIINPIIFKQKHYVTQENAGKPTTERYSDFTLPSSCIVDFVRPKIIGVTRINNGNLSTVKETFGFDDWQILIRGICYNDPQQKQGFTTVLQQQQELLNWERILDSIEVLGQQFTKREIFNLVIENLQFHTIRGNPNVLPFTIKAISDEDFLLTQTPVEQFNF